MLYGWDNSLETGNNAIDLQHQQLIERLNRLIIANNEGTDQVSLSETLDFLINYVEQHFNDEEELQLKYNYPRYKEHKEEHEKFRIVINSLMNRLHTEGYTTSLMNNTLNTMSDWFVMHINEEDLRLAIYIRQIESKKQ